MKIDCEDEYCWNCPASQFVEMSDGNKWCLQFRGALHDPKRLPECIQAEKEYNTIKAEALSLNHIDRLATELSRMHRVESKEDADSRRDHEENA